MTYCKISLKKVSKKAKYPDYQDTAFKALFGSMRVDPVLPFSRSEFQQESVKYTRGMSISGIQQKLSLNVDEKYLLVPVAKGGEYILKPSPEEFPYAAENEHVAMVSSKLLGIETAPCGLVSFTDGEFAYVTRRFDRLDDGTKLHQEDLLQGLGESSDDKYGKSYEAAGRLILEMTKGRRAVVSDFIRRVIHAYLIGNNDMHLKNTSLQKDADNSSHYYDRLTPNYDSLFTDAFENIDNEGYLALDLLQGDFSEHYLHYGYYTGYDFLEFSRRLEVPEVVVKKIVQELEREIPQIKDVIGKSYMPEAMRTRAIDLVASRLRALQTGIPAG